MRKTECCPREVSWEQSGFEGDVVCPCIVSTFVFFKKICSHTKIMTFSCVTLRKLYRFAFHF